MQGPRFCFGGNVGSDCVPEYYKFDESNTEPENHYQPQNNRSARLDGARRKPNGRKPTSAYAASCRLPVFPS